VKNEVGLKKQESNMTEPGGEQRPKERDAGMMTFTIKETSG